VVGGFGCCDNCSDICMCPSVPRRKAFSSGRQPNKETPAERSGSRVGPWMGPGLAKPCGTAPSAWALSSAGVGIAAFLGMQESSPCTSHCPYLEVYSLGRLQLVMLADNDRSVVARTAGALTRSW